MIRRRTSLKKLLLLLVALLLCQSAQADELPAPFTGYADKTLFLRPSPAASSDSLASIPAGTPIDLVPVSDVFAEVTYQGKTGYVYYPLVMRMPEETGVEPYPAYLPQSKYLFSLPLDTAPVLSTVQAETPVMVTGESGRFLRIEAQGQTGYVYARDTEAIGDMHMEACATEFWAETALTTRVYPLKNAETALTLEPSRVYIAEAVCNGYYRVTIGDAVVYVPAGGVETLRRAQENARVAVITTETQLFSAPDLSAATDERLEETRLFPLMPMEGGFQQLRGMPFYICANDVAAYQASVIDNQVLRILADAPLLLQPEAGAQETSRVTTGTLIDVHYATEDWYLVQVGQYWGFLPRDEAIAIPMAVTAKMMPTAAVVTEDAAFQRDGVTFTLRAGMRLVLTAMADDYYRFESDGDAGFISSASVDVLGSDTELTAYTVTALEEIEIMDFPDAKLGRVITTIPQGEKVRVTGFNRCYLIVKWNGVTGYAHQKGLLTSESRGIPEMEDVPACEVVLDKSTGMAYAFLLREDGTRGELVICAKVATGKRTTPTPTGTFLLGRKERWHAFTLSYTPHTTEYVKARYIHGWPCEQRRESTVKTSLIQTGAVTGGCLRSPFEFARWVYMNSTAYETQLVIVNGGFEAPEGAEAVRVR